MRQKTRSVFVSSTSEDMQGNRRRVVNAIEGLGGLPVRMEAFGANPGDPVLICQQKVRESDAVVVLVGRRYGWVPSADEGGDGKRSITWLEVHTAREDEKPIYAYLLDTGGELEPGVNRFRTYLDREAKVTRVAVKDADELVVRVVSDLARDFGGPRRRSWLAAAAVPALLAGILAFLRTGGGTVDPFAADGLTDIQERFRPASLSEAIVVVKIDEASERALGPFGKDWRAHHAEVIRRLAAAGARVVALDLYFRTPTEFDGEMANAIREARAAGTAVVVAAATRDAAGRPELIEPLREVVSGVGSPAVAKRRESVRLAQLALLGQGTRLPGIALQASTAFQRLPLEVMKIDLARPAVQVELGNGPVWWQVADTDVLTEEDLDESGLQRVGDRAAWLLIDLSPLSELHRRTVSYESLCSVPAPLDRTLFADKIVMIGRDYEEERYRVRFAGQDEERMGVAIHADAVSTLLHERLLHPATTEWTLCMVAASAIAGAWLSARRSLWLGLVGLVIAATALVLVAFVLQVRMAVLDPPTYTLTALVLAMSAGWLLRLWYRWSWKGT